MLPEPGDRFFSLLPDGFEPRMHGGKLQLQLGHEERVACRKILEPLEERAGRLTLLAQRFGAEPVKLGFAGRVHLANLRAEPA